MNLKEVKFFNINRRIKINMRRRDPLAKIINNDIINFRLEILNQEKSQFIQLMTMYFSAQTMLLLAYVTVLNISSASYLNYIFSLIGLILTLIFCIIFYDKYKHIITLSKEINIYYPQLKGKHTYGDYLFIGLILPVLFFIFWGVLIIYSIFSA